MQNMAGRTGPVNAGRAFLLRMVVYNGNLSDYDVKYLEYIPVRPQTNLILHRLGYRKGITALREKDRRFIDAAVKEALLFCHPRGAYSRSSIHRRSRDRVVLANGVTLAGEKLARFLAQSSEAVLMAATVGKEISDRIAAMTRHGDAAAGLVFDAVASQSADAALDWMMDLLNKTIQAKGKALTRRRYSPGYGDLTLEHQKVIYELLALKKIGIAITENFMLEPEKSVIAIAGIEVSHA